MQSMLDKRENKMKIEDVVEKINKKYGKEVCQLGLKVQVHQKQTNRDIKKTRWYKSLSIDELKRLGVLNVTKNGIVISTEGKIIPCHTIKSGKKGKKYVAFLLYKLDEDGNRIPRKVKDRKGHYVYDMVTIGLHRAVYLFNNNDGIREIPVGYDVDHIDNDPFNNDISNLQLLTRKENLAKDIPNFGKGKCMPYYAKKVKYTLGYIQSKISFYELKIEQLKASRTTDNRADIHNECHKAYSALAQWKKRLEKFLKEN